jgi:glutathione synthase
MSRYLIAADPLETLNPEFDLGVCLSRELLARGISVDYMDLPATDPTRPAEDYLRELPVQEVRAADRKQTPFWQLGPRRLAPVTAYDVILQRKDPPVDERFAAYGRHFATAPERIVQINRPPATHEFSEHTLHLRFPEYAAPTQVCRSWKAFRDAVRELEGESVGKPLNTYCGIGVTALRPDAPEADLRAFWEQWRPAVTVQPFLEEIRTVGDLRILTIQQRILGSVLRVPPPGTWIANLHAGGSAAAFDPTPRQLAACRAVARELNPLGLHLLGLDFIGEYLTEINITSPTLVVQINRVMGTRADLELIDELERMRQERAAG